MLEKIKDLFYDLTDFALVLIIIVVMISVISLKITDSLSINLVQIFNKQATENEAIIDISEANNDIELNDITIKPETNDKDIEAPEEIIVVTETDIESSVEEDNTLNKDVTITIKSGTTGYGIAKLLKENNLIDDTLPFVTRVEDLSLGAKLQSGTFKLNASQSLDEMIYIIAGKN
ncbi:MAG: hypothetical protein U9N10_04650 [Bacillota bacterium]|nr:hypothetical protein [Bacillota bacterium]